MFMVIKMLPSIYVSINKPVASHAETRGIMSHEELLTVLHLEVKLIPKAV